MTNNADKNIKNIWGKVILYLRENHETALYVACGDITDVSIQNDIFLIKVQDSTMFSVLFDGKRMIERALSWQGLNLRVEVEEKIVPPTKDEEDLKILKGIFKDKLTVKN